LIEVLRNWTQASFLKAFPDGDGLADRVSVSATTNPDFGDFQCNDAMSVGKKLGMPPRKVAERVVSGMGERPVFLENVTVAGPGFINMRLSNRWLEEHLVAIEPDPRLGARDVGTGKTVVIDYSAPNIAKPMHIGHIRSTNIGNALDRIHRFLGYKVISDNHLGDWGTQFGLLILGFRNFADASAYETDPIAELERVYVKSYERSKASEAWLDQARSELVKLQGGDPDNVALWRSFVEHSMREFEGMYRRLGVSFDLVRGESWYSGRLPGVVDRLVSMGIAKESEGALVVDLSEKGLQVCIIRKSDGGYNYATTDIATVISRVDEFRPDSIIYVTDERQQLHFRQIFEVASRVGISTPLVHVWFGLMRLPEGTFSTRQGNVIKLERLLDEAEKRALAIVRESRPDMSPEQHAEVARTVGIGAVKYADLSQNPQSAVTFTWDKAMALEGNSGPYLQYACARIASVKDKYGAMFPGSVPARFPVRIEDPFERRLAIQIAMFGDTVERAAAQAKPSVLCDYLFDLAQIYSGFYQNIPFLKAPDGVRESRVRLCGITASVLKTGLSLLGIETPERI
jgi:arginyl-tRNA synthetase